MTTAGNQISSYEYMGLKGRKLFAPARIKTNKVILLVYGQHISLERLFPMVSFLQNYGSVYLIDNPGFGNMESSYKLGKKPTLDFYDGHMKNIFDNELPANTPITVVGISYGFQLITHFLQNFPEYQQRITEVCSFVGFVSHTNVRLPKQYVWLFKYVLAGFGQTWVGGLLFRYIFFSPVVLVPLHMVASPLITKLHGTSLRTRWKYAKEQAWLWQYNEPRTHAYTAWQLITKTDLTNAKVALTCHHAYAEHDQFFDNQQVIADLGRVYATVNPHAINLPAHSPIDLEDEFSIAELVPEALLAVLMSD